MSKLRWRKGAEGELAQMLIAAKLEESVAVSGATLYRLKMDHREKIAIALPDGQALIIEQEFQTYPRRRRQESIPDADTPQATTEDS